MKTHILKQPVITEKSMRNAANNIYTFKVDPQATKTQIKAAIENLFNVTVTKVTTTMRKPKLIRTGRRRLPRLSSAEKLARVWLKSGDTIDLFEFKED